jgi:uncharacterized membrane protein
MSATFPDFIIDGIDYLALFFQLVGAVIITYGGFRAVYQITLDSVKRGSFPFLRIKKNLIQALVFGLDFFIIGDALATLLAPDVETVVLLILIVIVRTILSVFLMRELKDEKDIEDIKE